MQAPALSGAPSFPGAAGLLGKVPAQADFVRLGAQSPLAQLLHRWLEESQEALARAAQKLPEEPATFVFSPDRERTALVGVLAASQDRVGRVFPLAVFLPVDGTRSEGASLLPGVMAPFVQAALQLVADARGLDSAELQRRVAALPVPTAADLAGALEERSARLSAPHAGRFQRLFADRAAPEGHLYGLRTFLSACDAEQKQPGRGPVLDCPVSPDWTAANWMELALRRLPAPSGINALWTGARLLLGFGPPSALTLPFLANPEHPSMKRWPLSTRQPSAVEAARKELGPRALELLAQPEVPLEALLQGLAKA